MKYLKWGLQILLIIAFAFSGLMKVITPYDKMLEQMPWVEDFSGTTVMIIGLLELLAALGLFLPVLLKKYRFFVPLAAMGLALTMVVAMIVHINRGEPVMPNVILLALSLIVLYFRWDHFGSST